MDILRIVYILFIIIIMIGLGNSFLVLLKKNSLNLEKENVVIFLAKTYTIGQGIWILETIILFFMGLRLTQLLLLITIVPQSAIGLFILVRRLKHLKNELISKLSGSNFVLWIIVSFIIGLYIVPSLLLQTIPFDVDEQSHLIVASQILGNNSIFGKIKLFDGNYASLFHPIGYPLLIASIALLTAINEVTVVAVLLVYLNLTSVFIGTIWLVKKILRDEYKIIIFLPLLILIVSSQIFGRGLQGGLWEIAAMNFMIFGMCWTISEREMPRNLSLSKTYEFTIFVGLFCALTFLMMPFYGIFFMIYLVIDFSYDTLHLVSDYKPRLIINNLISISLILILSIILNFTWIMELVLHSDLPLRTFQVEWFHTRVSPNLCNLIISNCFLPLLGIIGLILGVFYPNNSTVRKISIWSTLLIMYYQFGHLVPYDIPIIGWLQPSRMKFISEFSLSLTSLGLLSLRKHSLNFSFLPNNLSIAKMNSQLIISSIFLIIMIQITPLIAYRTFFLNFQEQAGIYGTEDDVIAGSWIYKNTNDDDLVITPPGLAGQWAPIITNRLCNIMRISAYEANEVALQNNQNSELMGATKIFLDNTTDGEAFNYLRSHGVKYLFIPSYSGYSKYVHSPFLKLVFDKNGVRILELYRNNFTNKYIHLEAENFTNNTSEKKYNPKIGGYNINVAFLDSPIKFTINNTLFQDNKDDMIDIRFRVSNGGLLGSKFTLKLNRNNFSNNILPNIKMRYQYIFFQVPLKELLDNNTLTISWTGFSLLIFGKLIEDYFPKSITWNFIPRLDWIEIGTPNFPSP